MDTVSIRLLKVIVGVCVTNEGPEVAVDWVDELKRAGAAWHLKRDSCQDQMQKIQVEKYRTLKVCARENAPCLFIITSIRVSTEVCVSMTMSTSVPLKKFPLMQ